MTVPWRAATPEEIRRYYRTTFPGMVERLPERVAPPGPIQYGIALNEAYPTVGDAVPAKTFLRRHSHREGRGGATRSITFDGWDDLLEWVQTPAEADPLRGITDQALADPMLVEADRPVPEALYYSLQHHDRPWVVLLDIDAKDIAADRAADAETIEDRPPVGYAYTFEDINRAIEYGITAEQILQDRYDADQTQVYYTGQGVHVYLLDTDLEYRYDRRSRDVLVTLFQELHEIPIDGVVTSDPARFGRLPWSLHAGVSRVVTPVESQSFTPDADAVPPFLQEETGAVPMGGASK